MKLNYLPNKRDEMKQKREKSDAIIAATVFGIILIALKLLFAGFGI